MSQTASHRFERLRRKRPVLFGALLAVVVAAAFFWSDFCLWRAEAAFVLRNDPAAERWVRCGAWGCRNDARLCLLQLKLARRRQRYQDVQQLLHQAQKRGVPAAEILREQWLAMAQTQQFDEVSHHWPELLSDPRDDEPEIGKAFVIWASSRHLINEANHVLELWQKDYPRDPEPLGLQGQLALAMNHDEGAVIAYRKAVSLAPNSVGYRIGLATALLNRLELNEAATHFHQCLQTEPDNLPAIRGLAQVYTSQGELDRALVLLKEARKRFPDDLGLQQTLGEVYLAQGNSVEALPFLERIHQVRPEDAEIAYNLAKALKSLGHDSDAAPLFEFVSESREPLGQLKSLEEQYRNNPKNVDLLLQIAQISAKYKSRVEAIRWLEKLLLIAPGNRAAQDMLRQLKQTASSPQDQTSK